MRDKHSSVIVILGIAMLVLAGCKGRHFRHHDAISGGPLDLQPAHIDPGPGSADISELSDHLVIEANGIPQHLVGAFPNKGNPNRIAEQNVRFFVPRQPALADQPTELALAGFSVCPSKASHSIR